MIDYKPTNLFTNTTNNYVHINGSETNKIKVIEIYNTNGVLIEKVINIQPESKILMEHLNNGLYLIKVIHNNGKSEFHKVIKN